MTAYVAIANGEIDQDSPGTQPLFTALRDNPLAMFEGASGAPRLLDAALDATATNAGRDWILARLALMTAGALGTVAYLTTQNNATAVNFGSTIAGSSLVPVGLQNGNPIASGGVLSGTWMALGYKPARVSNTPGNLETTLFIRVL